MKNKDKATGIILFGLWLLTVITVLGLIQVLVPAPFGG